MSYNEEALVNRIMKHTPSVPFAFRIALLALLVAGLGAGSAWAQDKPGYASDYESAISAAKQAQQTENSGNLQEASDQYAQAYEQLADAATAAEEAGDLKNSDTMRRKAAQIAYKAGQMLYKDGQAEAAIPHFEAGAEIDPSFQGNQNGLTAAQGKIKNVPLREGLTAFQNQEYAQAIQILQGVEDSADKYFYLANAYLQTRDFGNAIDAANQAFSMGGLSASNTAQLYLTRGEAYMQEGDNEEAIADFQEAKNRGGGQVSDRAQGLLVQLGEGD